MKTLVIVVTIIGLSAVIGSIIIGKLMFDGKVVDAPYETGLRYDELEALKAELALEILNKNLITGENELVFTLKDKYGRPITDPQITLIISRPYSTRDDREYPVSFAGEGRYSSKVQFPFYGYWDIKIRLIYNWKPVILERRVYVEHLQSKRIEGPSPMRNKNFPL